MQYAVGDALVCDTLDEARKLAYHNKSGERYKVVTVDGTIINKAGLMTGGSSGGERARAARWNQQEYDALKARLPLGLGLRRGLTLRLGLSLTLHLSLSLIPNPKP